MTALLYSLFPSIFALPNTVTLTAITNTASADVRVLFGIFMAALAVGFLFIRGASLRAFVLHVAEMASDKEMPRVHAQGVIAGMANTLLAILDFFADNAVRKLV